MSLDYVIHGAGAIGSVIGARLHRAGRGVGLVARGAHLEALQERGLTVTGATDGHFAIPAAASAFDLDVDAETVVILTMKTDDTMPAVEAHAELYRDLALVCGQNGVSNEELLTDAGYRAYGCTVMVGGAISSPGEVWHTAGELLLVGNWPSGVDALCERVVDDLVAGDMDARLHPHVEQNKWGKLIRNLSNAYLALTDLSVQEASCREEDRFFIADVEEEAADALDAAGISPETQGKRTLREQIALLREPGEWQPLQRGEPGERSYPSTWQDLVAGRPRVEVSHFNGRIAQLGEQHGVATPLNRVLADLCNDAAARRLGPGTETTASLRAAAAKS